MDESEQLIARAALCKPEEARDAWRLWREANDITQASNLLVWAGGYVHRNLSRIGESDPYVAGIYRHNWLVNNLKYSQAAPTLALLRERWDIIQLKSFALSPSTYSLGLRPIADIDFYVQDNYLPEIIEYFQGAGFSPLLNPDSTEMWERIVPLRSSWNFRNDTLDFDVHWKLFDHLSREENQELIRVDSGRESRESQNFSALSDETLFVHLAVNHALQSEKRFNGLFDCHELTPHLNLEKTAEIARRAHATGPVLEILEDLIAFSPLNLAACTDLVHALRADHVNTEPFSFVPQRRVGRTQTPAPRSHDLTRPLLYRLWWWAGHFASIERLIMRLLGPFSRARASLFTLTHTALLPLSSELGPGWLYMYPGQEHRWSLVSDCRVAFDVPRSTALLITIELDQSDWTHSPRGSFLVFANGTQLGLCTHDDYRWEFELPHGTSSTVLELSLRPSADKTMRNLGIRESANMLLAPVKSITVAVE